MGDIARDIGICTKCMSYLAREGFSTCLKCYEVNLKSKKKSNQKLGKPYLRAQARDYYAKNCVEIRKTQREYYYRRKDGL